ncbi:hypothetical protein IWX90DRAFT_244509 [Phyllosticta citrichinensis]|uniref:DUF1308 domain-containing protein n=1 Tax=Phyllosticta citrichinensis TaxID=1130410 RepID=A0ABR1XR14_9PEZI
MGGAIEAAKASEAGSAIDVPASQVAGELRARCDTVLRELEKFEELLLEKQKPTVSGLRALISDVNAEKRFVGRLLEKARTIDDIEDVYNRLQADNKIKHQLSSTNLASYEAQWTSVKRYKGLVSLRQTFWRNTKNLRKSKDRSQSPGSKIREHVKKTQDGVLVDAVVENGATWLKVSAVSERQLLFQLARQGWCNSDSDSDDEDLSRFRPSDSDDDDEVPILKLARQLSSAAFSNRHKYRHPKIQLILPRISSSRSIREISAILSKIRQLPYIQVRCQDSLELPPPTQTALENLLVNEFNALTPELNIDCTLLVALASDISHAHVEVQPWYPLAVQGQIRDEQRQPLMPHVLYPAIASSRRLLCTSEAADRMRDIVATIGTETEVRRAELLIEGEVTRGKSSAELRKELQALSIHPVPSDLQLPIGVIEFDSTSAQLPKVAEEVVPHLTPINQSIFLYGWSAGITTLSSNGSVARQIETLIETHRTTDDEVGPDVWVCPMARSLVAKKGRRMDKEDLNSS